MIYRWIKFELKIPFSPFSITLSWMGEFRVSTQYCYVFGRYTNTIFFFFHNRIAVNANKPMFLHSYFYRLNFTLFFNRLLKKKKKIQTFLIMSVETRKFVTITFAKTRCNVRVYVNVKRKCILTFRTVAKL